MTSIVTSIALSGMNLFCNCLCNLGIFELRAVEHGR